MSAWKSIEFAERKIEEYTLKINGLQNAQYCFSIIPTFKTYDMTFQISNEKENNYFKRLCKSICLISLEIRSQVG